MLAAASLGEEVTQTEHRGSYALNGRIHVGLFGHPDGEPLTTGHQDMKPSWSKTGDRQEMAVFDLATLKTKTRLNEWSMIRVATEGPRIRVWFNRMHPSSDPDRGLRIDVTDEREPILSGAIGVCAHRVPAWFDNIVVLPLDALP